jgi:hypothetical protein
LVLNKVLEKRGEKKSARYLLAGGWVADMTDKWRIYQGRDSLDVAVNLIGQLLV